MRPLLPLFLIMLLAGCEGPGQPFAAGANGLTYASHERSGAVLVRVDDSCHSLLGTVSHTWNLTRYNPLVVVHMDADWTVTKLFWGLEFDGAKDLQGPGGVAVGVLGTNASAPALLPGSSVPNNATFVKDNPAGRVLILWYDTEGEVSIDLQSDCRNGLKVESVGTALGFRLADLEGGAHVATPGVSAFAKDSWQGVGDDPTFLMLRYFYSDAGVGTLTASSPAGKFSKSLLGQPQSNCAACLSEGRAVILSESPVSVEVTYAGNSRQTHVYGVATTLSFTPPWKASEYDE